MGDIFKQKIIKIGALMLTTVMLTDFAHFSCAVLASEISDPHDGRIFPLISVEADAEDGLEIDGSSLSFEISIPESGHYHIELEYKPEGDPQLLSKIEISVKINGTTQFETDGNFRLDRPWQYSDNNFDSELSYIDQIPVRSLLKAELKDPEGRYNDPVYFYFEKGVNLLRIEAEKGEFELEGIRIFNDPVHPDYDEVRKSYDDSGDISAPGFYDHIQAENYLVASDSTVTPENDPSDPSTIPNDPTKQLFNYIPGTRFRYAGQWIEWEFSVPETGLYNIDMRFRQDIKNGLASARRIYIDGRIPFAECREIRFPYTQSWDMLSLGDTDSPFLFQLDEGKHVLRMEVIPGALAGSYPVLDDCIMKLNSLYRSVVAITGLDADRYRTYNLRTSIPGLEDEIVSLLRILEDQKAFIIEQNGKAGSELASLQALINILRVFSDDPDKLPLQLTHFKGSIESLAAWSSNLSIQPLDLDYFRIYSPDAKMPPEKKNFIDKIIFGIRRLVASFYSDYFLMGDIGQEQKSISVWTSSGRDQLKVVRQLIDSDFSVRSGIEVKLSLATDFTSAITAGRNPDVGIFLPGDDPVRLGARNVLVDLSDFEDFGEIRNRFSQEALVPATYKGSVYGLPLTEIWPMMFVRNDLLEEFGLEVPQTWEEMYLVSAVLQRNNIDIGIPSNTGMFITLLLQNGGTVFNEDWLAAFDKQESIDAFKMWTDFFTKYSFPLSYDIFNRLRSGEMAIGIADYTLYAQLMEAAPEIRGLWSMNQLPGVMQDNGQIDRTICISGATGTTFSAGLSQAVTYALMFEPANNADDAWEFLKWFTNDETQTKYGYAIEAQLGPLGRYATANLEALERLPWSVSEFTDLLRGLNSVKAIDELPGNYYIAREINNAFRKVLYQGAYPVDTICQHNTAINTELARKHKEFGIGSAETR